MNVRTMLLAVVGALSVAVSAQAGNAWRPLAPASEADDRIAGSAARGDTLVICGQFDYLGDTDAGPVAVWTGGHWSAFARSGQFLPHDIEGVFAPPDGGWFVAGWEDGHARVWTSTGSSWQVLPGEFNGDITSLVRLDGQLVAAGRFGAVDGVATGPVARFDGAAWRGLAVDDSLRSSRDVSLAVYHDTLHALGGFHLDGQYADYLFWNGSAWVIPDDARTDWAGTWDDEFVLLGDALAESRVAQSALTEFRAGGWYSRSVPVDGGSYRTLVADGTHAFIVGRSLYEWDGRAWVSHLMPPTASWRTVRLVHGEVVCIDDYAVWTPRDGARVDLIPGGGPPQGALALAVVNHELFAGYDGGRLYREVNSVWSRDGDVDVTDLVAHDGELWATGEFSGLDGVVRGVARLAGAPGSPALDVRWRPWGQPLVKTASPLAWWDGAPIVLTDDGDSVVVLRGSESAWTQLGAAIPLFALAMHVVGGTVYVGGAASDSRMPPPSLLYAWRDGAWTPVAGPTNGYVAAIGDYGGHVAVGGDFDIGAIRRIKAMLFDGAHWDTTTALKGGGGYIRTFATYRGDLIAGGDTGGGTLGGDRLAAGRLHDGVWSPFGTGLAKSISALCVDGERLLAATDAAPYSAPSPNIGIYEWRDDAVVPPANSAQLARRGDGGATMHLSVTAFSAVQVRVLDIRGRCIAVPFAGQKARGEYDIRWDLRDAGGHAVAPGVYIVEQIVSGVAQQERVIVLP